jgi:hypothetical protein
MVVWKRGRDSWRDNGRYACQSCLGEIRSQGPPTHNKAACANIVQVHGGQGPDETESCANVASGIWNLDDRAKQQADLQHAPRVQQCRRLSPEVR